MSGSAEAPSDDGFLREPPQPLGFRAVTMPDFEGLQAAATWWQYHLKETEGEEDSGQPEPLPRSRLELKPLAPLGFGCPTVEEAAAVGEEDVSKANRKKLPPFDTSSSSSGKWLSMGGGSLLEEMTWLRRTVARYGSYFMLHLIYFCCLTLVGGIILYINEKGSITFIDALFTAASACSMTGLSSIDLSAHTFASQCVVFCLVLLGSNVLLSGVPLLVRRHFYRQRAQRALAALRDRVPSELTVHTLLEREVVEYQALTLLLKCVLWYFILVQTIPAVIWGLYASSSGTVAYKVLHGVEDVALAGGAGPDAASGKPVWTANPWIFGFFHAATGFNNCGFALHPQNLNPFASDPCIVLLMSVIILLGNTYYPIVMRAIVLVIHHRRCAARERKLRSKQTDAINHGGASKCTSHDMESPQTPCRSTASPEAATQFLLDNPRRCFTHMFAGLQTWCLLAIASGIFLFQFVVFLLLDFRKPYLSYLSPGARVLAGWFQSVSTRTAGFTVIDIYKSSQAMQLLWACLMYVATYPFIIAVRSTSIAVTPPPLRKLRIRGRSLAPCPSPKNVFDADGPPLGRAARFPGRIFQAVSGFFGIVTNSVRRITRPSRRPAPSSDLSLNSREIRQPSLPVQSVATDQTLSVTVTEPEPRSACETTNNILLRGSAVNFNAAGVEPLRLPPRSPRRRFAPLAEPRYAQQPGHATGEQAQADRTVPKRQSDATTLSTCYSSESSVSSDDQEDDEASTISRRAIVNQIQLVLLKDIFWLFLVTFVICVVEDSKFSHGRRFTVFAIAFETISAYGTVGLSLGLENSNASLSAAFSTFSKFLVILVMLSGRHRGLPLAIDKAVNLPDLLNAPEAAVNSSLKRHSTSLLSKIRRCTSQPCGTAVDPRFHAPQRIDLAVLQRYAQPVSKAELLASPPWLHRLYAGSTPLTHSGNSDSTSPGGPELPHPPPELTNAEDRAAPPVAPSVATMSR